ncbi:MAG: hypothetical protein ACRDOU_10520 [Streptosporangiaceae bacterium]
MRHLVGVLLAVVLAAAVFFGASWGYVKVLLGPLGGSLPAGGGSLLHHTTTLEGLGALAGVGLLAGLLIALPRVSPLASGLPGLALLAWAGLYIFSVRYAVQYIPFKTRAYGMGFEALLFDGILGMAGLVMIIPLFVPSRWRLTLATSAPAPYEAADETEAYPGYQDTQTLGDGGIMSDWAQTRPQPRVNPGLGQAPWGPADSGGPGGPA